MAGQHDGGIDRQPQAIQLARSVSASANQAPIPVPASNPFCESKGPSTYSASEGNSGGEVLRIDRAEAMRSTDDSGNNSKTSVCAAIPTLRESNPSRSFRPFPSPEEGEARFKSAASSRDEEVSRCCDDEELERGFSLRAARATTVCEDCGQLGQLGRCSRDPSCRCVGEDVLLLSSMTDGSSVAMLNRNDKSGMVLIPSNQTMFHGDPLGNSFGDVTSHDRCLVMPPLQPGESRIHDIGGGPGLPFLGVRNPPNLQRAIPYDIPRYFFLHNSSAKNGENRLCGYEKFNASLTSESDLSEDELITLSSFHVDVESLEVHDVE